MYNHRCRRRHWCLCATRRCWPVVCLRVQESDREPYISCNHRSDMRKAIGSMLAAMRMAASTELGICAGVSCAMDMSMRTLSELAMSRVMS